MKPRIVVSRKQLPANIGMSWYVLLWLFMDRMQPPEWVWGAVGLVALVRFVAVWVTFWYEEQREIDLGS